MEARLRFGEFVQRLAFSPGRGTRPTRQVFQNVQVVGRVPSRGVRAPIANVQQLRGVSEM
jgi:hypothetical protein